MAGYDLTIRVGPKVSKENLPTLDEAIDLLRSEALRLSEQADLPPASAFAREYEPGQRVAARIEVSAGGMLWRSRDAGIDVMGDGSIIAFSGRISKTPLDPEPGQDPFDAVREALARD